MIVCGIDEAGRGPLAGSVFAAAVVLPSVYDLPSLNDSKKLTAKRREALFELIKEQAIAYAVAFATVSEIDEINILEATLLSMRRALEKLPVTPNKLLIDGNISRGFSIPAEAVIGGDGKIPEISAASIIAKVSRDREMLKLDELYPQYGFARHKGYGTPAHIAALREFGPTPEHREIYVRKVLSR